MKYVLLSIVGLLTGAALSQVPTIGLRVYDSVTPGYIMFSPEYNNDVYLVNECGEQVNKWTFSETPGSIGYLLENGNLLRAGKDSLEIRDWNNQLLWSYDMTGNGFAQHHDIEPLPNGNILCICRDTVTDAGAIAAGRDPALVASGFRLDRVVELQPVGTNGVNLVWQWSFYDHLVQDYDAGKPNYGVVADHPELLDFNFDNGSITDFIHLNGIDYNATLDQIIISSRNMSEIYIIDHSTTMAEAAGHTGGNFGRGGDLLWHWGNPLVYQAGGTPDQQLFKQHDPRWVEDGYPDAGKISVFNNEAGGSNSESTVVLLEPTINGTTYEMLNNRFLPEQFDWSWGGNVVGEVLYEGKKCGVQVLSNGNMLVAQSSLGQMFELTRQGEVIWVYRNPAGQTVYPQFYDPISGQNDVFKANKYEPDYPGLNGMNLDGTGIIENENEVSQGCLVLSAEEMAEATLELSPNPVIDILHISGPMVTSVEVCGMDGNGLVVTSGSMIGELDLSGLSSGVYILRFVSGDQVFQRKVMKQ